ncbi:MAG TPA: histidine kinase [Candidatus Elarobacter sp.]|nr:histidine kinase [Candidatus Elarobacter sp.]
MAPSSRPDRIPWGKVFAIFTVPAVIAMLQTLLLMTSENMPLRTEWPYIALQLPIWYTWALFTPVILALGRRFPPERDTWKHNGAIHMGTALAFTVAQTIVFTALQVALSHVATATAEKLPSFPVLILHAIGARVVSGLVIYAAILAVGTALEYGRRAREREVHEAQLQTQLTSARLEALKMQLRPHFLFNTLHAISVLVHENPERATAMVARLGDLLRLSLSRNGEHEVPLARELEFVRLYLEIEQTRFHDRLQVTYDIDPSTLSAGIPDMILQPLVENAIKHGIAKRAGPGRIVLSARRNDGALELRVRDDGPGYAPAARAHGGNGNGNGTGIGLATTRARLEEMYGASQHLDVSGAVGGGCEVAITLPFRVIAESTHA